VWRIGKIQFVHMLQDKLNVYTNIWLRFIVNVNKTSKNATNKTFASI